MTVIASDSAAPPLTLFLFGPMQVRVHDRPLPHLRSRKALWLLALLALRHGRPVEREWLAGTLWPDTDQTRASTNLSVNLSELRRALGDQRERLQSPNRHTLTLDLSGVEVDVHAFDAAMQSKEQESLRQAVELYRGPLLADCAEEWIAQERAVRQQQCLFALQTLADVATASGDPGTAIGYYQQAVRLDPNREVARRGWMEALAKGGDRNGAMQVYREYAELLRNDLNATPDAETSTLYQRLRAEARQQAILPSTENAEGIPGSPAFPTVVKGYLPHPVTNLIGREEEREDVAANLRASRLVTLTGPGGIGKTRLALAVARESVEEGLTIPDGAWFVGLEAIAEGSLVVAQIVSTLGVREEVERPLLESLTDFLRSKRLLLVLDNCEHLLDACAQAAAYLLRECAAVRILATSREALGITGETVWQVPSLPTPSPAHLPPGMATRLRVLMGYESVQLFVERAEGVNKGFALSGSNAGSVAQVCSQLEGIPLAIELAAARVKAITVEQIAARLDDHLRLLTTGSRTAQRRQQTLRATLDWSYALLTEAERRLLSRLSTFAGGWTLEAAEQVCAEHGLVAGQVVELLISLVEKSLVVFEEREGDDSGRYRLLETVRQYAAESLQTSGEAEQTRARHKNWFMAFAEETERHLQSAEQGVWLKRSETEYGNLRAALEWKGADALDGETGLRLAGALRRFWDTRGYYREGQRFLEQALGREETQARTAARAKALKGVGTLAISQGNYTLAQGALEESLSIYRELRDKPGIADALNNLGGVAYHQNQVGLAREVFMESLAIRREMGDKPGIATALNNLSRAVRYQGEEALAQSLLEESRDIRRELGDKRGVASSNTKLGFLAGEQGDYPLARTLLEESLRIFQDLGDTEGQAWTLNGLGHVAYEQGDYIAARTMQEEALGIFQDLDARRGFAWALHSLGEVSYQLGDYAEAQTRYANGIVLFQELEDRHGVTECLRGMGNVLLAHAQTEKAVRLWAAAEKLRDNIGVPLTSEEQARHSRQMAEARTRLSEESFATAWEEGSALSWEQAVAFASVKTFAFPPPAD